MKSKGADFKMNGIIKRRKTSDYAQIHNTALQQLEDIKSIGLIAHLMSLPESWEIKKTALYNKFGRGPMTTAIKELESKKYWVTIKYRDGRKTFYYYNVSDVAFDDSDALKMITEVNEGGYKILEISESFTHLLSIGENQQLKADDGSFVDSSIVGFQQLKFNSSFSTVENRQLLNKSNKTNRNKQINMKDTLLINKELTADEFKISLTDSCNEFYTEFAPNRWDKKSWLALVEQFVNEKIEEEAHLRVPADKVKGYAYQSLKNIAYKHDLKNGKIEYKAPFYDWLNEIH
jgi:hypothetical protein